MTSSNILFGDPVTHAPHSRFDLLSVDRNDVDPSTGIDAVLLSNGDTYFISALTSGDLILVPQNDTLGAASYQKILRLPPTGGTPTTYLDPSAEGLNGQQPIGGRVDSADRLILVYHASGSETSITVRRYAADLLSHESFSLTSPESGALARWAAVSPDGTHVAIPWFSDTGATNVFLTEYDLENAATMTTHASYGEEVYTASTTSGTSGMGLAVGYDPDGGALYGFNFETITWDGNPLHAASHNTDVRIDKYGGTGGNQSWTLRGYDPNPAITAPIYVTSGGGVNGWIHGELAGSQTVYWLWSWFDSFASPNAANQSFVTRVITGTPAWNDWTSTQQVYSPIWGGGGDGSSTPNRRVWGQVIGQIAGLIGSAAAVLRACTG